MRKCILAAALLLLFVLSTACTGSAPVTGGNASAENTGVVQTAGGNFETSAENPVSAGETGIQEAAESSAKPALVIPGQEAEAEDSRLLEARVQTESLGVPALSSDVNRQAQKAYTVMIYMTGSDLESRIGAATKDLEEIAAAGADMEQVNVLVYAGGCRRWNCEIPNDKNSVLDMARPAGGRIVARTQGSANMGSAAAFASFVNFCTEYYPADHYTLILWDHGGGPLWGYGMDELYGGDGLVMEEMRQAIGETIFAKERKLDIIGFDACLMGSVETVRMWKEYARYLVASEEVEAGDGWDYSFLKKIGKDTQPSEAVSEIVSSYGDYYDEARSAFSNPDVTMAAVDLEKASVFLDAVDTLALCLQKDAEGGSYAKVNQARMRSKALGLGASGSRGNAYDLVDVGDLCRNLNGLHTKETQAVLDAMRGCMTAWTGNVDGANGLSIYLPGDNEELYQDFEKKGMQDTVVSEAYRSFLRAYTSARDHEAEVDWTLAEYEKSEDGYDLQLTPDQAANFTKVTYSVLQEDSGHGLVGAYHYTTSLMQMEADRDGKLHIPMNPSVLAAVSDSGIVSVPMIFKQLDLRDGKGVYQSMNCYLSPGQEFKDLDVRSDTAVNAVVENVDGNEEVVIRSIYGQADSPTSSARITIDVSDYRSLSAPFVAYHLTRDDEGKILPFYEWRNAGVFTGYALEIDSDFHYVCRPVNQFDGEFYAQVLITDVRGAVHASELVKLGSEVQENAEEITLSSGHGKLTFALQDAYAVLVRYEGEDTELEIPKEAGGLPVEKIGKYAFPENDTLIRIVLPPSVKVLDDHALYRISSLKELILNEGLEELGRSCFRGQNIENLKLPESLRRIKRGAFSQTGIRRIRIPPLVEEIGDAAWGRMNNLEAFEVDESNSRFCSVDGVLLTADRKSLLAFPQAREGRYQVPEGVEEILYGAFAHTKITAVELPESVRKVWNCAFFDCELEEISLPDNLLYLGHDAFGGYLFAFGDNPVMKTMHIGSKLHFLGNNAFDGQLIGGFDVDPENPYFSSGNGLLLNKAGDTVIQAPRNPGRIVVIPDGVSTLEERVFANLPGNTEFIIPDSVYRIPEELFPYTYENLNWEGRGSDAKVFQIRIHCSEGSAAETYAKKYSIPYDNETDPDKLGFREVETTDGWHILNYRVYSDHAVLLSVKNTEDYYDRLYQKDENGEHTRALQVEIPSEIEGVPVTGIGVPGQSGLLNSSFQTLIIPGSVSQIEPGVLNDSFFSYQEIKLENSSDFKMIGPALYSADGKTLISTPAELEGSFSVAVGTEKIGEKAFCESKLSEISLPDSLTEIEEKAFYSCDNLEKVNLPGNLKRIREDAFRFSALTSIDLPEGLEEIENYAFSNLKNKKSYTGLALPSSLTYLGNGAFSVDEENDGNGTGIINVGEKLTKIERGAFQGLEITAFEVDPANPAYLSKEGLLYNKAGSILYCCPAGLEGTVTVPEGVRSLEIFAFSGCRRVTDVVLPDSMEVLESSAFDKDYSIDGYHIRIHSRAGTTAEKFARENGIEWVETGQ